MKSVATKSTLQSGWSSESATLTLQSKESSKSVTAVDQAAMSKVESDQQRAGIRLMRRLLVVSLLLSALSIAACAYTVLRRSEVDNLQTKFETFALKLAGSLAKGLDEKLAVIGLFALDVQSFARYSDSTWPYVTIPEFPNRAATFLNLTNGFYTSLHHHVEDWERSDWEAYTANNNGWIQDALDRQAQNEYQVKQALAPPLNVIYDVTDLVNNRTQSGTPLPGPYLPIWQNYPIWHRAYNYNGYASRVRALFHQVINEPATSNRKQSAIAPLVIPPEPEDSPNVVLDTTFKWYSDITNYDQEVETPYEPTSDIFFPIENITQTGRHAAVISVSFYWRYLMRDILPDDTKGIYVVFTDCQSNFTYLVEGPHTTYLGRGIKTGGAGQDFIETITTSIADFNILLDDSACPIEMHITASDEMVDEYITPFPAVAATFAVAILVLSTLLFFVYDQCVGKQKERYWDALLQSNQQLRKANHRVRSANQAQLQHFAWYVFSPNNIFTFSTCFGLNRNTCV